MLSLEADALARTKVVIYGACLTAAGVINGSNIAKATYDAGADTVIGFQNRVEAFACNRWREKFFYYYAMYCENEDMTILDVCQSTDLYVRSQPNYEYYNSSGNLVSLRNYVIFGSIQFCD